MNVGQRLGMAVRGEARFRISKVDESGQVRVKLTKNLKFRIKLKESYVISTSRREIKGEGW
jgi:hypothetical protein